MDTNKICVRCKAVLITRTQNKFCSRACASRYQQENKNNRRELKLYNDSLPKHVKGTIGELTVINDLLQRGYEVFRPVTPCCSCDLIASKKGYILRIEVKTAVRQGDGFRNFSRPSLEKYDRFDVLAIATQKGIYYEDAKKRPIQYM